MRTGERITVVLPRSTMSPAERHEAAGSPGPPPPMTRVPPGARIQFANHLIELGDGRRVGISVGGRGVPLVFFHGIGMNRHVYLKLLSRLPQLGFLVVAIDAPGHGETFAPKAGELTFAHRMAVTEQIMESLGIEKAVLVGHSMGGRTAAELAARHPERALAVILVDPAIGAAFDDASRMRITSLVQTGAALIAAVSDTVTDRVGLRRLDHLRYLRTLSKLFLDTASHPATFASAATAIATADESAVAMSALRAADSTVVIIHGEQDKIVPLHSAVDAAAVSGASLITLPAAHHSWVLTTPWTFAEILARLITEKRLGPELTRALAEPAQPSATGIQAEGLYKRSGLIGEFVPPIRVLGTALPRRRRLYHPYRFWTAREVADFAAG